MSALGALVARVVGSVGGPVATGAIVVGGVAAGALGGGLFASGGGQQANASGQLPVYPCPDTGPQIALIQAGQQVLATGRTADSTWLRIHFPEPGRPEAWVAAGPLTVEGSVASLPVADCQAELAIAPPSTIPDESLTPASDNPPSAPPATATPTPSSTPNSPPAVSSLTASTNQVSSDPGGYCPNAIQQVTFKVKASDAAGVAGVSLFWRKPGASAFTETPMTRVAGSTTNGTWQVALDTTANGITGAGSLAYYAQAKDAAAAARRIPVSGSNTIAVKVCQNPGPTITALASSSGGSLSWDPLGAGGCQTASNITAIAKDSDGVASATLFYRKPGAAAWSSKPMDDTTIKGRWYANLDTLGDKITIPSPPTGTLRWYIKATDAKGASSQTPQHSLVIRRCDSEATFYVDGLQSTSFTNCSATIQLRWSDSISDPDEAQDARMTASLRYTITNTYTGPGGGTVLTQTVNATIKNGRFFIDSKALSTNTFYGTNQISWRLTTKDKYGGTSVHSSKDTFIVFACIG